MKYLLFIPVIASIIVTGCKKTINVEPQSNLNSLSYYANAAEVRIGLSGTYSGLQAPLLTEWMLTELRSDNVKQGVTNSSASGNRELNDLDMFTLNTTHPRVYDYWLNTYNNIRNANTVLQKLGVVYNPATGSIQYSNIGITISDAERKQMAGEALFIRAQQYFNLVRLFGGVFLVYEPITPVEAKLLNRVSTDDIYKLIQADLKAAADGMNTLKYAQIPVADLGRATGWAAKALLGKVYLTLNKKTETLAILTDVKDNSGYALQSSYANVFSIATEVNAEILFTIRYKAGGVGLGSTFANLFAPTGSGAAVINGDGSGLNYPTIDFDSTIRPSDGRKATLIARFGTGATQKTYTRKYLSPVLVKDDAENDWPVLRFADVLLMIAEAQGYTQASLDNINLVRARATGLTPLTMATTPTLAAFEDALSTERRIELGFENQRWFDLLRFNTTLTTITTESAIKAHFAKEYQLHYRNYPAPALTLAELQAKVTRARLLLPIPQREIDTNTNLVIPQNPEY